MCTRASVRRVGGPVLLVLFLCVEIFYRLVSPDRFNVCLYVPLFRYDEE